MSKHTKHVLLALLLGGLAYVLYKIFQAAGAVAKDAAAAVNAPINAAKAAAAAVGQVASDTYSAAAGAVDNIVSGAQDAALIPVLSQQSQALDQKIAQNATNEYAPGGTVYIQIANTQGQAAADADWAAVQKDLANQAAQTAKNSSFSIWSPSTW